MVQVALIAYHGGHRESFLLIVVGGAHPTTTTANYHFWTGTD
jgi:hypothetical protein